MDFLRPYAPQGSPIELRLIGMMEVGVVDDLSAPGVARCAFREILFLVNRPPIRYGPL
jgi:hypothetical protein